MSVEEPTSEARIEIWDLADSIVSTRLLYVETSSALARTNLGIKALDHLEELWAQIRAGECAPW